MISVRSPQFYGGLQIVWAIFGTLLLYRVTSNGIRPAYDLGIWPANAPMFVAMYVGAIFYVMSGVTCCKKHRTFAIVLTVTAVGTTWNFALLASIILLFEALFGQSPSFGPHAEVILVAAALHIFGNAFFLATIWFVRWDIAI